jgi:hypothetical protein
MKPVGILIVLALAVMKLVGILIVLAAAYATYHWLWGRGWLATSACFLIWFLLASLYKQ